MAQVIDQHGLSGGDRVQAWPFAQSELDLVEAASSGATGAEGGCAGPVEDDGNGGAVRVEQLDTDVTDRVGCVAAPLDADGGDDPVADLHLVSFLRPSRVGTLADG